MLKPPAKYNADELAVIELENHHDIVTQSPFGISRIQRLLKWSYNRATHVCDRLTEQGILVRIDESRPQLMSFASQLRTEK